MHDDAPRIGQTRRFIIMVDRQTVEAQPGLFRRLKNSLSIESRGVRRLGDLPKTCHLLPSTAIL